MKLQWIDIAIIFSYLSMLVIGWVLRKSYYKRKDSWPQAEALIGFFNAYQVTRDSKYLEQTLKSWKFIINHLLDKVNGEWYWGVNEDYSIMKS